MNFWNNKKHFDSPTLFASIMTAAVLLSSCDEKRSDTGAMDDGADEQPDGSEDSTSAVGLCSNPDSDECKESLIDLCADHAAQGSCEAEAGVGLGDGNDYRCGWGDVTTYSIENAVCAVVEGPTGRCYAGFYPGECLLPAPFARPAGSNTHEVLTAAGCVTPFEYEMCGPGTAAGCACVE